MKRKINGDLKPFTIPSHFFQLNRLHSVIFLFFRLLGFGWGFMFVSDLAVQQAIKVIQSFKYLVFHFCNFVKISFCLSRGAIKSSDDCDKMSKRKNDKTYLGSSHSFAICIFWIQKKKFKKNVLLLTSLKLLSAKNPRSISKTSRNKAKHAIIIYWWSLKSVKITYSWIL